MARGLEVWVARPGSACRMDDGNWLVTVYDAHKHPFGWAGMSYADMPAPTRVSANSRSTSSLVGSSVCHHFQGTVGIFPRQGTGAMPIDSA